MEKQQDNKLAFNLIAGMLAYAVTCGVSFVLSPYIVENVGVDANGYIGLANNFISYASLIAIALNSLAGRFITVKLYQKDTEGANKYFSSVFIANLLIAVVMLIGSAIVVVNLEKLIKISSRLTGDVKLLFTTLFITCILSTVFSVYSVSTFAVNKLYLSSARLIESNILKALLLVGMFYFLEPKVSYMGITALVAEIYVVVSNIYYMRKLLPEIRVKKKYFDIKAIIELVSSGVWNLINRLGQLLLDGLDLLISNVMINPDSMGILSVAKTVPMAVSGLVGSLVGVFSPNFTILYAREEYSELVKAVRQSIRIMGFLTNLPIIILIVCGDWFYSLWQPTQNAQQLQLLSILTCGCIVISGGINCIYNIFTVVNKLKLNSIVVLVSGVIQITLVYVLLKTTDLELLAVAGVSTVISIIRNLVFTAPYGARCLKQKWYAFYPDILKTVLFTSFCCTIGIIGKNFVSVSSWIGLVAFAGVLCIISMIIGAFIVIAPDDRELIKRRIFVWIKK